MKIEQVAAWGVTVFLLLSLFARLAAAAPTPIRYQNRDPLLTGTVLRVCHPFECASYLDTCGPLEVCQMTAELPPGNYPVWLQISEEGTIYSENSNIVQFSIGSYSLCDFDYDRDGVVTVQDFGIFLRWYQGGYITTGHFADFLQIFGRSC